MNDDIQLIIEALESYTGLPWDYLKVAHPSIEKLFKSCAGTISRDDLIEISKTICDRCTMGDKLCDAIMNLLSVQPNTSNTLNALDCISRQAAIAVADQTDYLGLLVEDVKKVTDEVVKGLKQLPPAQPEPQWIPCSERLPEISGQYYVSGGDKVWICEFLIIQNFIGGWCNDVANPVVRAWMPLPKPYREEGEQDG